MRHEPLVERFERLRFQSLWHLSVDQEELKRLESEVLTGHPRHPLTLNHAARLALPETELPAPPRGLSAVASAFLDGDIPAARALLKRHSGPRISVLLGDLALADRDHKAAEPHYESARSIFGAHPPLLARLARCALSTDRVALSTKLTLEALSINPLHGSSRALLGLGAQSQGQQLLALPLYAPVRVTSAGLELARDMPAGHRDVWRAWYQADAHALPLDPPKATAHRAMLNRWRTQVREPGATDALCAQLQAWKDEGLLGAYQWSTNLSPENAQEFRDWVDANPTTLIRFWAQAIRKKA